MKAFHSRLAAVLSAAFFCILCAPLAAQAGLFDDEEARKAVVDLRAKVDAINSRLDGKTDKTSALDLAGQNERLQLEISKLRGQIEVLTNELANEQRRQKDFYTNLDSRLRKLEPQKSTVDGKEVSIDPAEQRVYDAALATFKAGDYKEAATAFFSFVRLYPRSGYTAAANYWLGNAYYAQRDYKSAIATQQIVVKNYPDNPKAPDALLNIASCYTELKDKPNARKTLETLVAQYPDSGAAQTAKDRLATLK